MLAEQDTSGYNLKARRFEGERWEEDNADAALNKLDIRAEKHQHQHPHLSSTSDVRCKREHKHSKDKTKRSESNKNNDVKVKSYKLKTEDEESSKELFNKYVGLLPVMSSHKEAELKAKALRSLERTVHSKMTHEMKTYSPVLLTQQATTLSWGGRPRPRACPFAARDCPFTACSCHRAATLGPVSIPSVSRSVLCKSLMAKLRHWWRAGPEPAARAPAPALTLVPRLRRRLGADSDGLQAPAHSPDSDTESF